MTISATDPATNGVPGTGVKSISYSATQQGSATPYAQDTASGSSTSFDIGDEGVYSGSYSALDEAGNQETSKPLDIRLDVTKPTISGVASPAANGSGWNNSSVTVSFTCSDALSGVASCGPNKTLSGQGAGQSANGTATDHAGNSSSTAVGVSIDLTPPSISAAAAPAANAAGWNRSAVTVSFTCSDALSGVASCSPPQTLSAETAGQSVSGVAADMAGNGSNATLAVKIDLTPPAISGAASPAANAAGWNNTDVTVAFSCTDSLSGIASCGPDKTLNTDGPGQSATGTGVDTAGNPVSATVSGINVDKTPPVVTVTGVSQGAVYVLGSVPTAGCSTTDATSGVLGAATLSSSGGSTSGVGTFTASCGGASDNAGNAAPAKSVSYDVRYDFQGYFSPVDNLPMVNRVKAGQGIPLKFSLAGNFGLGILAPGYPVSQPRACGSSALLDDVEQTVAASHSELGYDATSNQYIYVWATSPAYKGTCRALLLKFNDGRTYRADFSFK